MLRPEWLGGALVAGAIGLIGASGSSERGAREIVERLGGHFQIEPRFGLDCLGVIVKIDLNDCAPTARDLAGLKDLRHLRILDLSLTPIGDRELAQLVDSSCQFIIVPDGQTSQAVRAMIGEDRVALGISAAKFGLPSGGSWSMSAAHGTAPDHAHRISRSLAARRMPPRAARRPASGRTSAAAMLN